MAVLLNLKVDLIFLSPIRMKLCFLEYTVGD